MKLRAPDEDVLTFMAAVFPDAPALAIAAFDEGHVLRTATERIATLEAALAQKEILLEEAKGKLEDQSMRGALRAEFSERVRKLEEALRHVFMCADHQDCEVCDEARTLLSKETAHGK